MYFVDCIYICMVSSYVVRCMWVLLFSPVAQRQLSGRAVNQSLQYRPTEDDEVEDLFLLLKEVKVRLDASGLFALCVLLAGRSCVEGQCYRQ